MRRAERQDNTAADQAIYMKEEMKMRYSMEKTGRQFFRRIMTGLLMILVAAAFAACGSSNKSTDSSAGSTAGSTVTESGKLRVVATVFPEYDWIRQILGENPAGVELTLLLDNGADLHSYQPTAEDITRISTCDLFVYVGGESDEWVDDALKEATNKNMEVVNLLEVLGESAKEEEVVEGMQKEPEHEEAGHEDADHSEEHQEEKEYDEHVWLSLRNAKLFVNTIAGKLENLDTANADTYRKNAKAYTDELEKLDGQYKELFQNSGTKTLLFGDRFPFRYMVDDYGLSYYAAFVGCSAETEASFETITFLAGKVDELGLGCIYVLEGNNHKIAETIRNSTGKKDQDIVVLNSMQSVNMKDIQDGAAYLDLMRKNYDALKTSMK